MEKQRELIYPEWGPQPGESPRSFELFRIYRDMKKRSYAALAQLTGVPDSQQKKEANRIGNMAARWRWQLRVIKYEDYIANQAAEDEIKVRKEMNKRLAVRAQAAETALMLPIQKLLNNKDKFLSAFDSMTSDKQINIVMRAIEKLVQIGEFERKVQGEPSEQVQQNTNVSVNVNYDSLSHDELKKKAKELGFERKY